MATKPTFTEHELRVIETALYYYGKGLIDAAAASRGAGFTTIAQDLDWRRQVATELRYKIAATYTK